MFTSDDLKNAALEIIELIGNESIRYYRNVLRKTVDASDAEFARLISEESLRYFFRLIFLCRMDPRPFSDWDSAMLKKQGPISLFDPGRTPLLGKVRLNDSGWQRIIGILSRTPKEDYVRLDINQLGAVYEKLLPYRGSISECDPVTGLSQKKFQYKIFGRDRKKTASFYTPRDLAKCLVEHALKELIGEKPGDPNYKSADEILKLTVCEPAMGPATFLYEAVNQLAGAYIRRKQDETGLILSAETVETETRNIRTQIAERNIFGVDLNPIAVELGEAVLWFDMNGDQFDKQFGKKFGNHFLCGDSLIGARREVFDSSLLVAGKNEISWLDTLPTRIPSGEKRNVNTVYHFLLLDPGMADYRDAAVKSMSGNNIEKINRWRSDFSAPFREEDKSLLENLSLDIDRLWTEHVQRLRHSETINDAYRRLKRTMDYWCSLWFWPIEEADNLPTRDEYLLELKFILHGENDISRLVIVQNIAAQRRFFHWELEFADLFEDRGGFDLILGNPPWIKWSWDETGLFSEHQPDFAAENNTAPQIAARRTETIEKHSLRRPYFAGYEVATGTRNFLKATCNYPLLHGMRANLFKCFLPLAWRLNSKTGVSGFVHPEGVYDDTDGKIFRTELYSRLREHFQFVNELNLFPGVDHHVKFSINIYGAKKDEPEFRHISNLFAVKTIAESFDPEGDKGKLGGIKDGNGVWNTAGHPDRVIEVDRSVLSVFADLFGEPGTKVDETPFPSIHTKRFLNVLKKISQHVPKWIHYSDDYCPTVMWNETTAQKDNTIRPETRFPDDPEQLILSGPHFSVGNPVFKTPRRSCTHNSHYDVIDLTILPEDYLPRTNYIPAGSISDYRRKVPRTPWSADDDNSSAYRTTDYYRLGMRAMLNQSGERTLIGAILPKQVGHINGVQSVAFRNTTLLLEAAGFACSIVADFFIKLSAKENLHSLWQAFPHVEYSSDIAVRTLLLNCLTRQYSELWAESWNNSFKNELWTKNDSRLPIDTFGRLSKNWIAGYPLRTDFARRQALVEIDVLVARSLGLTLEELCEIYRIQFFVLKQYENDTWYDQSGRIVFTCRKGRPGVGLSRSEWNRVREMTSGTISKTVVDNWLPEVGERTIQYTAPFDRCDRENDYKVAWEYFDKNC